MRSSTLTAVILGGVLLAAVEASAQTLGDVAKKEEARRKTVGKPSKIYTNESLKDDGSPAPPPAPAASTPASDPAAASAAPATAPAPKPAPAAARPRDEKYWRGRLDSARTALTRAQTVQEALQSRINALSTDFVNRDDPAQRNVIAADRQKALAELDRVKQEIAQHQKAIVDIQEEGRRAGVPAGWLR
jgi:hypothetical protein